MAFLDVCPLAAELSVINSHIICPEEGCDKVFKASSALNMHLTKHHRNSCLAKRDANVTVRYFCPEPKCIYHVNASRHFTQMKYLKQHYIKVHSEKKFSCESCNKAFATQELLKYHLQICGIKFVCSCGNFYSSYEALLTHSKRKQHTFDDKFKSGSKRSKQENVGEGVMKKDSHCFSVDILQPIYILPKPATDQACCGLAVNVLSGSPSDVAHESGASVNDKSMQTDPIEPRRRKIANSVKSIEKSTKRRASAQTQAGGTLHTIHPKKSAETQTMGDYILMKAMADADILSYDVDSTPLLPPAARKRKNNSGTQTGFKTANIKCSKVDLKQTEPILEEGLDAMCLSPGEAFSMKRDVGLPDLWVADKNTSSTQTVPYMNQVIPEANSFAEQNSANDLNLELLMQESSLSSSNLQSIFEDSCNSFDTVVSGTANFNSISDSDRIVHPLSSLASGDFASCNVSDQNLNHLYRRDSVSGESHSSFTMRTTTETQTTDDLTDLESLLYNNMWTQTSEDSLFSGLDFADIQTQTAWPLYVDQTTESVLVSAETQTGFGSCSNDFDDEPWANEPSHIETQTCEEDWKSLMAELEET